MFTSSFSESSRLVLAIEYANAKHKGQKRKDGSDYIHHPVAVAAIISERWKDRYSEDRLDYIRMIALLHDVLEDTDATPKEIKQLFGGNALAILQSLNKNGRNYFDYIQGIWSTTAILVKLADLEHNMSDLDEGSMKDKYRFAHHILTNRLKDSIEFLG